MQTTDPHARRAKPAEFRFYAELNDFLPADSRLSSYTLGRMSRFALVYTSTLGLELACAGVPVVVAGDTHYRDLGFTLDVDQMLLGCADREAILLGCCAHVGLVPHSRPRGSRPRIS